MKSADFELYQKILYDESGLVVTPEKSYLLDSRLSPIAKRWDLEGIDALTAMLRTPVPNRAIIKDVVEAMTTNETSFFRDMTPFNNFENAIIPYLLENKAPGSSIKIWCAACSSGQEPYSLAMLLKENEAKLKGMRFDIYATDLSTEILDTAKTAKYSQFEVQRGMPIQLLMKYFTQEGEAWHLNDDIKRMIRFEPLNLLKPFAMPGKFDIIFCRNVLIYFDKETKKDVLERLHQKMHGDGFLFLGGAETVFGITESFKAVTGLRGLYVPQESDFKAPA